MSDDLDVVIDNVEELLRRTQKLQMKHQSAFDRLDSAIDEAIGLGDESGDKIKVAHVTEEFIQDVLKQLRESKSDIASFNKIMIYAFKIANKIIDIAL